MVTVAAAGGDGAQHETSSQAPARTSGADQVRQIALHRPHRNPFVVDDRPRLGAGHRHHHTLNPHRPPPPHLDRRGQADGSAV